MCAPWDTSCIAGDLATAASNTVLGQISDMVVTAEEWLIATSASWWVLVPSISLYPDPHNTDPNATPIGAVANLHALILPITVVIAMGGMLSNGLLMVLSRKPAPLVNVLRGLWNTALWSVVGVFGTNLLLTGTDAFSTYVITSALHSVGDPSLGKRLTSLLVPIAGPGGLPVGVVLLVGGIAMVCAFVQAVLMLFRDGAVLILAALMPLAASGSFTNATNGWKNKVLAWQLSLIFYKATAALVYAVMIWLTGESTSKDPRILLIGMAMMLVSLVALPVLLKFFNWTVGSLASGGAGLGMLATAGAAGMHAAASLRGASGGFGVNEHARFLSDVFDRSGGGGPAAPTGSSGPGPGPMPAGPTVRPPTFTGPTSAGSAAPTAAASGAGGAGAAMGASAATGPAAPVVAGTIAVTSTLAQTSRAAAHTAANAASDSTKDG